MKKVYPKGKARMAPAGYYVPFYVDSAGTKHREHTCYIDENNKAQWFNMTSWSTLVWSCAPTQKQLDEGKCIQFETYLDFKSSKYYNREPKSTLDK